MKAEFLDDKLDKSSEMLVGIKEKNMIEPNPEDKEYLQVKNLKIRKLPKKRLYFAKMAKNKLLFE